MNESESPDGISMISDVTMDTTLAEVPVRGKQRTIHLPQDPQPYEKVNDVKVKYNRSATPIASNSTSKRQLQTITNTIPKQNSWVDRLAYQETVSSRRMKESLVEGKKKVAPIQASMRQPSSSKSVQDRLYEANIVASKQTKTTVNTHHHHPSSVKEINKNSNKTQSTASNSSNRNYRVVHPENISSPLMNEMQILTPTMPMKMGNISSTPSIHDRLYKTKTVSLSQSAIVSDKNRKNNQPKSSMEHGNINRTSSRSRSTDKTSSTITESTKVSPVHERLYRTSTVSLRGTKVH